MFTQFCVWTQKLTSSHSQGIVVTSSINTIKFISLDTEIEYDNTIILSNGYIQGLPMYMHTLDTLNHKNNYRTGFTK